MLRLKKVCLTPRFMVSCTSWLGRQIEHSVMNTAMRADEDGQPCFLLDASEYLMHTQCAYGPLRRGDDIYI